MWASFKKGKLQLLSKCKAKGEVDSRLTNILDSINTNQELVTSSSCSGRIVLLEIAEKKGDAHFYRKWHREVGFDEVWEALRDYKGKKKLWFRCEAFIIHIFAEEIEAATSLLKLARKAGFKRGGIWGFKNDWPFLELIGTNGFSLPVFDKKPLTSKTHCEYILKTANKTLKKNYSQLKRFEKGLRC
ncbi:MAG: hypothetical protein ABIG39_06910 [Candidatus Micrarchaeota archaeon]